MRDEAIKKSGVQESLRLQDVTLERTLFTAVTSAIGTFVLLLVIQSGGKSNDQILLAGGLNLLLNLVRAIYGVVYLLSGDRPSFRGRLVWYRALNHVINFSWVALAYNIYQSHGLQAEGAFLCLMVTCGMMAAAQMSFLTMLDLSLGTAVILGLGTSATLLAVELTHVGLAIASLAPVFAAIMGFNAYQSYQWSKQSERQLTMQRDENLYMKSILNAVPGFMTILDYDLRYVMTNDAFNDYVKENVIGHSLGHVHRDQEIFNLVSEFKNSGSSHELKEVELGAPGRRAHYLLAMSKINQPRDLISVISINIEQHKKVELELAKARSDAEHAGRLIALGEMVSSIAHEIRNPLSVIDARAVMMVKASAKGQFSHEAVEQESVKIKAMVTRVTKIMDTVLKFSRGESSDEMVECGVGSLIDEACTLTAIKCKTSQVELKTEAISPGLTVSCSAIQIGQVLVNLVNNAVDALEGKSNKWIELRARDLGEQVEIRVIDSGLGIPPEIRSRLLEPFFTTKPPGKGTGLGLSISRRIVEKHLGSLTIDADAPNTTFVIILPKKPAVTLVASNAS